MPTIQLHVWKSGDRELWTVFVRERQEKEEQEWKGKKQVGVIQLFRSQNTSILKRKLFITFLEYTFHLIRKIYEKCSIYYEFFNLYPALCGSKLWAGWQKINILSKRKRPNVWFFIINVNVDTIFSFHFNSLHLAPQTSLLWTTQNINSHLSREAFYSVSLALFLHCFFTSWWSWIISIFFSITLFAPYDCYFLKDPAIHYFSSRDTTFNSLAFQVAQQAKV